MKRIQVILAVLAIAVTSFAAVSGPAMAQNLDCRDARGDLIRCDGDFYSPYDNDDDFYFDDDYYDDDFYFDDSYYFSPYFFTPYYNYYGDYYDDYYYDYGCEGPVCLID